MNYTFKERTSIWLFDYYHPYCRSLQARSAIILTYTQRENCDKNTKKRYKESANRILKNGYRSNSRVLWWRDRSRWQRYLTGNHCGTEMNLREGQHPLEALLRKAWFSSSWSSFSFSFCSSSSCWGLLCSRRMYCCSRGRTIGTGLGHWRGLWVGFHGVRKVKEKWWWGEKKKRKMKKYFKFLLKSKRVERLGNGAFVV